MAFFMGREAKIARAEREGWNHHVHSSGAEAGMSKATPRIGNAKVCVCVCVCGGGMGDAVMRAPEGPDS